MERLKVEQYTLVVVERGGFQFVGIDILTDDQNTHHFEMPAPFAYALSDELLKTAVHAAPKASNKG